MNKEQGPSTSLDLDMRSPDALDQITQAVAQAARSHQDELMGVGLAIPGFSKPQDPDIVTAPILGWNQVDLGRLVRERTGLPVIIDNDVNALLLAHRLYSPQPTGDDLLITIGIGIGAAFTSQGQIIHGGRGG
ncbi:MAG: Xylose operon repressor, partial [Actinomyces urogenitalis DORA_12]